MDCKIYDIGGQLSLLEPQTEEKEKTYNSRPKRQVDESELIAVPYQRLDLTPGHGDLLGDARWEWRSPVLEDGFVLNTGVAPREPVRSSLTEILEKDPGSNYYLSRTACLGILRRAEERGKELPAPLKTALMAQAGLALPQPAMAGLKAYHINQRDEGIDLDCVAGALMATNNMQMQTFVTNGPTAFAQNQRDEVRDLHNVAGALSAQPGMKQQTFVAMGVIAKGNGECFLTPECHTSLSTGGGQAGQGYPCVLSAGFNAGAGSSAGSLGYQDEVSPTLKGSPSGNMMPSVVCLNDQGGERMDVTVGQTTTLRAQAGGHQPLVLNDQGGSVMDCTENVTGTLRAQMHGHQPLVFNAHGQDCRFQGPAAAAQTVAAAFGMGGGNMPLVMGAHAEEDMSAICITGNAIDRQPQNGGNGLGISAEGITFTLTATDRHAVFSRQRVDVFMESAVASTESARQHKDATDLVYQETVGALTSSDRKGPNSQYVGQDKLVVASPRLIRRLTPLECERLQGFPDGWTDIPGASDSARYKALGNSVAIPCVEFVMGGIALAAAA